MTHPRPLVMAGPSGVGKGTLISKLLKEYNGAIGPCVSTTSRAPRPGEEDGRHYHFREKDQMLADIDSGLFLEHADVHGKLYGTSFQAVEDVSEAGKICILEIDVQGVESVKNSSLQPYYLFIEPPSLALLEKRLRDRGTETEEQIIKRTAGAKREMDYAKNPGAFDRKIMNDDFNECYDELLMQLNQWYPGVGFGMPHEDYLRTRVQPVLSELLRKAVAERPTEIKPFLVEQLRAQIADRKAA